MSHRLFKIHELVEVICEAAVVPPRQIEIDPHYDFEVEEDSVVPQRSQRTLAMLARVNKFIGEIALKTLWRGPATSFMPFFKLFPEDYMCPNPDYSPTRFVRKRPPTVADYKRFIHYSKYVRYLDCGERYKNNPITSEVLLEDYSTLFPTRPVFPRLKALICSIEGTKLLSFLLHSGIRSLHLDRPSGEEGRQSEGITATDLQASLPNLLRLQDLLPLAKRITMMGPEPAGTLFQRGMDSVLHKWTHLRHLEVSRFLSEFPTFFGAVSRLQCLQYLKIAIARRDKFSINGMKPALGVVHTASKLDIEGEVGDLHLALGICNPGTQLTRIGLRFYSPRVTDGDPPLECFTFPPTLSQKRLTELTITGYGCDLSNAYPTPAWRLPCSVFSTLATPKCNFTTIEIETPYFFVITKSFLDLIAETSPALKTFVVITHNPDIDRIPMITLGALRRFALALPNLTRLGLEVDARSRVQLEGWKDNLAASENLGNPSVSSSSSLEILEVGVSPIRNVKYVVEFLRRPFAKLEKIICDNCCDYCSCGISHAHWADWGSEEEEEHSDDCDVRSLSFILKWRRVKDTMHEPLFVLTDELLL
ncbi:hypothetical protein M408DRAFT_26226 [Serendipita vermifera MAFF 305830]|uniref:F-box domain-containing protein n=1 Tax=Serendipita vermifera MAFF 305830 TaxID=933852 RepID=A0A0C3AZP3_SERVB|nr:hypothetical protein M408DRAFT_26226 [Serendipita vermifera MAFF 305830]